MKNNPANCHPLRSRSCIGLVLAWTLALLLPYTGHAQTTVEYIHTDALGSPVAVTDASGNIIEREVYEPYGSPITHPPSDQPGFTGHVADSLTNLTYMQQRYYDPQVGRFLSVDPVTAYSNPAGAFNRYWYANNNPYRFTDPDGRWVEDTVIGVPSIILGSKSLYENVKAGNVGSAIIDGIGIVADAAAIAAPGVPGGAGLAIKAGRAGSNALDAGRAASKVDSVADGRSVWTATSDGVVIPPGKDFDLVPTSTPNPRDPQWVQVHGSHPHKGDPRPHAHGPEAGTGRRSDQPLAESMRRADRGIKDGTLRERVDRSDKGGTL